MSMASMLWHVTYIKNNSHLYNESLACIEATFWRLTQQALLLLHWIWIKMWTTCGSGEHWCNFSIWCEQGNRTKVWWVYMSAMLSTCCSFLSWPCRDIPGVQIAIIWVNAIICMTFGRHVPTSRPLLAAKNLLPPISFFLKTVFTLTPKIYL